MFPTFFSLFSLFPPWGAIWEENSFLSFSLSLSLALTGKNSSLKNCWVCYKWPDAGKIPEWLIINLGKPLNFTAPLTPLTGIILLPTSRPPVLSDISKYLWNTNIDPVFNVFRDPNCWHPKITYSPNGDNMTDISCDYPGDTVTCQHCNGTSETYICTKHHDFRVIDCIIHEWYVSGCICTVLPSQTWNYTQTKEAWVLFDDYIKNITHKPCLRSLYRTCTQDIPGNLSADPNLNLFNFTTTKLLCLSRVTYSLE
jgi:hypothetical protein